MALPKPTPIMLDQHCFSTVSYSQGAKNRNLAWDRGCHEDLLLLTDFLLCHQELSGQPAAVAAALLPPHFIKQWPGLFREHTPPGSLLIPAGAQTQEINQV